MSKRIISYSLWGSSRLYCENGLINIELAKKFYPDFRCLFYIAENCPALPIYQNEDCDVVVMPPLEGIDRKKENWKWDTNHLAMMWRYFAIDECAGPSDIILMRDCDSHLSKRESEPIYDWINNRDELLCAFYENEYHYNGGFQGGMWAVRANVFQNIKTAIEEWTNFYKELNHDYIFIDLVFNQSVLLPMLKSYQVLKIGYDGDYPLPKLDNIEDSIGWVKNENWREQKFNPEEYIKEAKFYE